MAFNKISLVAMTALLSACVTPFQEGSYEQNNFDTQNQEGEFVTVEIQPIETEGQKPQNQNLSGFKDLYLTNQFKVTVGRGCNYSGEEVIYGWHVALYNEVRERDKSGEKLANKLINNNYIRESKKLADFALAAPAIDINDFFSKQFLNPFPDVLNPSTPGNNEIAFYIIDYFTLNNASLPGTGPFKLDQVSAVISGNKFVERPKSLKLNCPADRHVASLDPQ